MSDHPMRVAFVSVSAALGGSEWVLLDLVSHADRAGVEPLVVLPKEGPLLDALAERGVPRCVAAAPASFLELARGGGLGGAGAALDLVQGVWSWSRAIDQEIQRAFPPRPDDPVILYSNGFKAHVTCAALRAGRPRHVWHLHEFPPARIGLIWRALAGALPDATIANSRSVADAWQFASLPPASFVHNGVDLERFRPAPRTGWIHDQLGLDRGARLIGMPAVFARWKGHLAVVDAFESGLARTTDDVHLVLVGGPIYDTTAERGYAEELVRRVSRGSLGGAGGPRPMHERVHFLKFQNEPWTLYPEFDVVVHFSTRPEPFGRVILEAMASGVPVIAAKAGGPTEIVEHGVTGWLVTPGDVRALAQTMSTAVDADRAAMGAAGRRAAERRFSVEQYVDGVAAVLRRVYEKAG
jgi:glycosyltransferase involved in cell wall biosynthesis